MKFLLFVLVVMLTLSWNAMPTSRDEIYFDASNPELVLLGNTAYYEIGFRKSNGAIAFVIDKTTGQQVTLGSRHECLWGAVFPDGTPDYIGGCNYSAAGSNRFSYYWSEATHTLTLVFSPDPAATQRVTAQVTVTASPDAWFDMGLQLHNDWGHVLDYVLFPSDLVFAETAIKEVLLPVLPGVVFEPAFFDQNRSYTASYPGYPGLFADYIALTTHAGHIAIYSLYGEGPLRPAVLGLIHDDEYVADSTFYHHTFGARIDDGTMWTSPQVRIRISQTTFDTIVAYRVDNNLDRFPPLRGKLGSSYDQVVRSPLYKADTAQLRIRFTEYPGWLFPVPTPGILHPVAYQPGGHDEHYPDFVPPDRKWGTTENMKEMFQQVQEMGFQVMPYTNPTWWDDESPTLKNLPPSVTITDVAVLDDEGAPIYENYGSRGGYVVSPQAPFVQQRLHELNFQMTYDVPSDILFEDQIGARPWLFDHNRSAPHPVAYVEGWLEHTRTSSDTLRMTELGFDRLAEVEVGFHGSLLLPERFGSIPDWWGADTWSPYPLAPILTRDKTLFYQHDLAPETMTMDKATLTWNLAFGYMLSYDLYQSEFGGGLGSPWLGLVAAFQKHVLARYADQALTGFLRENDMTRTAFESYTVTANWDEEEPLETGPHTLSPLGVVVTSNDGAVTAGIFTAYNGASLSPGDHYLIEARGSNRVTVHQPVGSDTALTIDLLPVWAPNSDIEAWAYTAQDQLIASIPIVVTEQGIDFAYEQQIAGQTVAYYTLSGPSRIFLPLMLKHYSP